MSAAGTAPAGTAPGGPPTGLVARGVTVRYRGRAVLDDVDLDVPAGSVLAVTGPSGSGKSTLLGVLGGLVVPDAGTVAWDGAPVALDDHRPGRRAAMVLQGYGLLPVLTAHENVELALQLEGGRRGDGSSVRDRASAALADAGLGPDELTADRLAEELSGGQQQRVAVARALVVRPRLLLADEPTSELDTAARDVVLAALRRLADDGVVVVLATHDTEVAQWCDARLDLVDGKAAAR
ncbi:ABC transporter ATP-binding protein [Kineosporia sp. A_224]|uniref:ABC transporter ATP-binding protein n=1 Tax=Kineosporia sp. A_224 TaxID=1962180 RepID=UPI0018E99C1E|nr:ATP-binding cassette domain-containing protein [Kineosporia sp. A_224]